MLLYCIVAVVFYLVWMVITGHVAERTDHWAPDAVAHICAQGCACVLRLLRIELNIEFDSEEPARRVYIVAVSPHSCFPLAMIGIGTWKFRPGLGKISDSRLCGWRAMFAGASVLFSIPLLRELLLLCGVRDASRRTVTKLLSAGHTIAVNPGPQPTPHL